MKKFISFTILILSVLVFNSCEDDATPFDYVGFDAKSFDFGIDIGGENTRDLKVYTTTIASTDRTFNLSVIDEDTTADPESYTIPATVTVPANSNEGTISIIARDINITSDGKELALQLSTDLDTFTGQNITILFKQVCPSDTPNPVILSFTFDAYPEEIYWVIEDSTGGVFAESATPANFGAYAGLEGGITQNFCMPDGTYTFIIFDFYSDGICCNYGNGSYSLAGGGNIYATGGSYGASESTTFTLGN
jgi:hypothetical protein